MKNIIKHIGSPFTRSNIVAATVIYVLVIWCTYILIELIGFSGQVRSNLIYATHIIFAYIITVAIVSQWKIGAKTKNEKAEKYIAIILTIVIYIAFAFVLLSCLGAIAIILSVLFILFIFRKISNLLFLFFKKMIFHKIYKKLATIPCTMNTYVSKAAVLVHGVRVEKKPGAVYYKLKKINKNTGAVYYKAISKKIVFGTEEIPAGVFLIAYGHKSSLDYFLWPADLPFRLWKIVAGTNLLKFFPFNIFLLVGAILIDRSGKSKRFTVKKMLESMVERVNDGYSVGFSPEKGRFRIQNPKGYKFVGDYFNGGFNVAFKTKKPILPVIYMNAGEYKQPLNGNPDIPKGKWYNLKRIIYILKNHRWFNQVTVVERAVLAPIFPEINPEFSPKENEEAMKKKARNAAIKAEAFWWGVRNGRIVAWSAE